MGRSCDYCGKAYDAKRSTSKYCSSGCRADASLKGKPAKAPVGSGTHAAVLAKLEEADRACSPLGAMALALAARVDDTPGSGAAALVRELRATLDEALQGVASAADPVDELSRQRAKRRAG